MPLVKPLLLSMNEHVDALEKVSSQFSAKELNLSYVVQSTVVKDADQEASLWRAFLLTCSDDSSTESEAATRACLQSFFNARVSERAQFAHTVLSGFARTQFQKEGRALAPVIEFYWNVALDLFQPKLLAEMVSRLFPGIQRSVGIDGFVAAGELPISENFTLTMQVSNGVQLIDNDESATDVDQLLNLIVDGDVLLDLRHVQRLPLRQLTQFVELLEKSHPALVTLLSHRTSDLDQMLSHVGLMREKGMTLRAVLQNLITALQMGGVESTGKEDEVTTGADSAARYFCYQFLPILPRELRNQFLALNAPHARKVIIQGVEHVPSIGLFVQIWTSGELYCVSEAAKSLTSIARYNPNQATLDQQAPRLTLQQRQQVEAHYGQQELAVYAAEPTQVIPEKFAKEFFDAIEVSSPTVLIKLLNIFPPSHFLQLLRYVKFLRHVSIFTMLLGGEVQLDPLFSLMDSTFRALLQNEGVTPTAIRLPFLRALLQLGKPLDSDAMRRVLALTPTDSEVLTLTDEFPSLRDTMLDWATSSSDPMPINVTADVLRFFPQELRDTLVNAVVVTQFFAQTDVVETFAKVFMMFSASARQQLTLPNRSIASVLKLTPLILLDDLKRLIKRAVATHTLGFDEYHGILKATHSDETSEYAGELRAEIEFKNEEETFMAISSWRDHLDQRLLATHFKKFTQNDWDSFGNNPLRRILSLEALAALIRCLEKWQDVGPNTIQPVAGYPLQSPSYGMFIFAAKILWGRDPEEVQKLLPEYAAAFTHADIKQNKIDLPITVWQTVLFYAGLEEFRKPLLALSKQLIPQERPTEALANALCDALSVVPNAARLALVRNVRMVDWVALLPMDSLKKVFAQLTPDESVELLREEWCAGLDTLEDMVVNKGLACWLRLRSALPPSTIEVLNQQHVPLPAFKKVEDLSYVLKLTQTFEKIFEDHLPATIAALGKKDIKKSVLWEVIDTENALTGIHAIRYATVLARYATKTPDFKPSAEKLLQHLAKKFPNAAIAQVSKANGVELPGNAEQSSSTNTAQLFQSGFLGSKK